MYVVDMNKVKTGTKLRTETKTVSENVCKLLALKIGIKFARG